MDWIQSPLRWASFLFSWLTLGAVVFAIFVGLRQVLAWLCDKWTESVLREFGITVEHFAVFYHVRRKFKIRTVDEVEDLLADAITKHREDNNLDFPRHCPLCGVYRRKKDEDDEC